MSDELEAFDSEEEDEGETLADRVRVAAVLEGDFVLRSGRQSRFYVDKYRFGTEPVLLAEIGSTLADFIAEVEPEAVRIGAPEVGAISLAAAASMVSGLPFVIVRKAAKEYGTTRRLEGVHAPGERVVVVEDVVTSGGAAIDSVRALRDAGLVCETVICVVDRLEGGAEAMQDEGISLYHLLTRTDLGIPE